MAAPGRALLEILLDRLLGRPGAAGDGPLRGRPGQGIGHAALGYAAFGRRQPGVGDGVPLEPPAVPEPAVLAAVGLHSLTARPPHHNPPPQPAVAPPGHDQASHPGEDEYPPDDLEVEE